MSRTGPGPADSAGIPWRGRDLKPSPFSGDSGHADKELESVFASWKSGKVGLPELVVALEGKRVIVPVMAEVENLVVNEETNLVADKDASTGVVCVSAPDGRIALPIFSSVPAMTRWNKKARPIPVEAERAALAAVSEEWPLLVLDPGDPGPAIIPRPAVWALAQGKAHDWVPAPLDAKLANELNALLTTIPAIERVALEPGNRAETAVILTLRAGLNKNELNSVLASAQEMLAANERVAEQVDSLELRIIAAS